LRNINPVFNAWIDNVLLKKVVLAGSFIVLAGLLIVTAMIEVVDIDAGGVAWVSHTG
jgi:hypothetical protein